MKVVCKKAFRNMKVGQITTFTPSDDLVKYLMNSSQSLTSIGKTYRDSIYGSVPIGCVSLIDEFLSVNSIEPQFINCFIFYKDFRDCFCTIKEYRKLKLNKINNVQG